MKKGEWHLVTDGISTDFAPAKWIADDDIEREQRNARMATDGTLWWTLEYPKSEKRFSFS